MLKKYFDENNYLVGISMGDLTENSEDIFDISEFNNKAELIHNKPIKPGCITHITEEKLDYGVNLYNYNFIYEDIPMTEWPDELLKEKFKEEVMNSITIMPHPAEKEGFNTVPKLVGNSIVWEFEEKVEQDNPSEEIQDEHEGTYLDPIPYVEGMTISAMKWYTDGEDIWEAIKDGVPMNFQDEEYFEIVHF